MMKNRVKIVMSAIVLLSIVWTNNVYASEQPDEQSETEIEANTDIVFDADAIKNKTAAKSALADMHGVFVFRDAFINQEKIVKEEEKKNREEVENLVLTSTQPELDYEEWIDLVLAADMSRYIKDVYIEEKENSIVVWIGCISVSVCFLCVAIRIEDYRKKKKVEKKEKKFTYENIGIMFLTVTLCSSILMGCGQAEYEDSFEEGIVQTLRTEGEVQKVMELEEGTALWMSMGNKENNADEVSLYVVWEKEKQIDRIALEESGKIVLAGDIQGWEYLDANGDGKKDILLTLDAISGDGSNKTEAGLLIFIQNEDGTYKFWEDDEELIPIYKRA